jgi:hypothetical protein
MKGSETNSKFEKDKLTHKMALIWSLSAQNLSFYLCVSLPLSQSLCLGLSVSVFLSLYVSLSLQ